MTFLPSRARWSIAEAVSLLLLLSVTTIVLLTALRSPLKDDIAWLLYVAHRWIAGRELYVDVVEVNPPLIIWISAVPLLVARWLSVAPRFVALPSFALIALACAWWSACLLRSLGGLFVRRIPVFAVIGAVLLVIPAADLGQREHLLVAAFLPYLILFARSLVDAEAPGARPARAVAVAAGVLAALGCALKPQYCLAFAALEALALAWRVSPLRAAPIAAAATLTGYFLLIALICPAYLRRAVPMALALYGATDVSLGYLLMKLAPLLAAQVLAGLLAWRDRRERPLGPLLLTGLVFAAVSSVIVLIDGKDWFYHRLPATVVTLLLLILWVASAVRRWREAGLGGAVPSAGLVLAGVVIALFCVGAAQRLRPEVREAVAPKATTVARLEALIRLHHAHTYMAFSEWIALGFPVVNNTGVRWASRFDSMWALKGEIWRARDDPATTREWPITRWVAHDFIAGCPDIAVVDTREGLNYIAVLSKTEPAFARVWARYKQIVAFDGLQVYLRTKGRCIDPWVAAQGPGGATTTVR